SARKPRLAFEGADVDDLAAVAVAVAAATDAALVGAGRVAVVAVVDGWAARQQGVRPGGAAVVRQGAEPRVGGAGGGAHHVPVVAGGEAGAPGAVADQVVAGADESAGQVRADTAVLDEIVGDDGVADAGGAGGG